MASTQQKQQPASANGASGRLWGGRFTGIVPQLQVVQHSCLTLHPLGATDPLMEAYNESIHFDRAFFAQDIAGSIAFARANIATGILTKDEFAAIEKGLKEVLEEWRTNKFVIKPGIDETFTRPMSVGWGRLLGKR